MNVSLNAGDICTRIVTIADRRMTVAQGAQLMREHHVGCLVVTDETAAGRRVAGVLTDRDIVTTVVAMGMDPARLLVEDLMVTEVVNALETDSIADLLGTMQRKGLRRLPVTTPQGMLIGLATLDDVLEVLAEQLKLVALAIEAGLVRERAQRTAPTTNL